MLEYDRLTGAAGGGVLFRSIDSPQEKRRVKQFCAYAHRQTVLPFDIAGDEIRARQEVQEHWRCNEIDKEISLFVVTKQVRCKLTAHVSRAVFAEPVEKQRVK